jgi:hypothetical protein
MLPDLLLKWSKKEGWIIKYQTLTKSIAGVFLFGANLVPGFG